MNKEGKFPVGVSWNKRCEMYAATGKDSKGKPVALGNFPSISKAHAACVQHATKEAL